MKYAHLVRAALIRHDCHLAGIQCSASRVRIVNLVEIEAASGDMSSPGFGRAPVLGAESPVTTLTCRNSIASCPAWTEGPPVT